MSSPNTMIGGGIWCSHDEHSHNHSVLCMQNFKVLVLGGVLDLAPSTLFTMERSSWCALFGVLEEGDPLQTLHSNVRKAIPCVPNDPKLLDDGGEILKSQGRGWRFDSRLLNFFSIGQILARWSTTSYTLELACLMTDNNFSKKTPSWVNNRVDPFA